MRPKQTQAYRCEYCGWFYNSLFDAAYCCASDRHPLTDCWRCDTCRGLYASINEAASCCKGDGE